jgi:hypothetical protein
MKRYSVFLHIEEWGDEVEMEKQFKKQKKVFLASIAGLLAEKKVSLPKKQETALATDLLIDEGHFDEVLSILRASQSVDIIDAEYTGETEEDE